jgi:hypothetical protein
MDDILGMLLDPTDLHLVGGALFAQTHLSVESNEALEAISMVALTAGDDPACVLQPFPSLPSLPLPSLIPLPSLPLAHKQASSPTLCHASKRQRCIR